MNNLEKWGTSTHFQLARGLKGELMCRVRSPLSERRLGAATVVQRGTRRRNRAPLLPRLPFGGRAACVESHQHGMEEPASHRTQAARSDRPATGTALTLHVLRGLGSGGLVEVLTGACYMSRMGRTAIKRRESTSRGGRAWRLYWEGSVVWYKEWNSGQGAVGNKSWVIRFWDPGWHSKLKTVK